MKLKYSPCKSTTDTQISVIDENTLIIDGEEHKFPVEYVTYDVESPILEAKRIDGVLHVTVLRFYSGDCTAWDTGEYHDL